MSELDGPPRQADRSFGAELRKEREIRGISLREIADATKISHRFLEAIERDDYKNLPAPVFTKGFIKEYAKYVGLTADSILDHYTHFVREREEEEEAIVRPRANVDPRPSLEISIPSREPKRGIWILLIVIAVAGAAFYAYRGRLLSRGAQSSRASTERPASRSASPPPTAPLVLATTTSAPAPQPQGLRLTIRAREDSWIALDADGESVINEVLPAGEERSFSAEEEFLFRTIGNAGGIDLVLNGTTLPSLGESGEVVRDFRLDRSKVAASSSSSRRRSNRP